MSPEPSSMSPAACRERRQRASMLRQQGDCVGTCFQGRRFVADGQQSLQSLMDTIEARTVQSAAFAKVHDQACL